MKYKIGDIVLFKSFSNGAGYNGVPLRVGKIISLPKTYSNGDREPFATYVIGTSENRYHCFNPIIKANKFFRRLYGLE